MEEDSDINPNIEWKKKSFENKERLTLKINVKQAIQYEVTEKKNLSKAFSPKPSELPKGLKKIRKKIKDIYDDDEDEDENEFQLAPAMDLNNSLYNALHEDEKRQFKQQETIKNINMQQNAGRMEAITMADRASKDLGLKGISKKNINKNMIDVSLNSKTYENVLKDELSTKAKIKGRRLSDAETINLLRGIKRIQALALASDESKVKALEGWKIDEIVDVGRKDTEDKKIAKKILVKSGRKVENKKVKKMTDKANAKKKMRTGIYQRNELFRE